MVLHLLNYDTHLDRVTGVGVRVRLPDSGKLAAFGADVVHDEWRGDMRESAVVQYAQTHDNVILTPHIGGATDTSIREARVFAAKKLAHYLATGEELTM